MFRVSSSRNQLLPIDQIQSLFHLPPTMILRMDIVTRGSRMNMNRILEKNMRALQIRK